MELPRTPSARVSRAGASLAAAAIALALALGGCSGSASGSGRDASASAGAPGAAAGSRHRMAQALASLGLSDDQKQQIRGIMKSVRAQNANVSDPTQKRANFRAAMQRIETVLTDEQRAKLHAKLARLRGGQESPSQ